MDAELKAKWVKALRSGEYRQGDGNLIWRRAGETKFCCLGVLCQINGAEWDHYTDDGDLDGIKIRDGGRSYLSGALLKRFGFDNRTQEKLGQMNDDGVPFAQIADYIEANIPTTEQQAG